MGDRWTVVDRRTNKPVTIATFPSEDWAINQITQWQDRHERGGRRDITRDLLLNMSPRLISEALPWGSLSASTTPEEPDV